MIATIERTTCNQRVWQPVSNCDVCGGSVFEPYVQRGVDDQQLTRCRGCGLVLLNPRPDAEGVAAWYDRDYFTAKGAAGMGSEYLEFAEAGIEHGTEGFLQFVRRLNIRGRKLLEIGCGGGAFLVQCRNAGADVAGLDVSSFAAERLQKKYGLDVRVGTVEAAAFEAASFDIVAFTDVIEHVLSPTSFLSGIHHLLRPNGVVYGLLPNVDCVAHYGPDWAGFRLHAEHLYYVGRRQLELCLEKTGFVPKEIWTWGEPWEPESDQQSDQTPRPPGWRHRLRTRLGRTSLARAARHSGLLYAAIRKARGLVSPTVRSRYARYQAGLGHDLCFLAIKTDQ